ncbi:unnamed protein product [Durusdinium trenchii]|uniref:Uncharacterized protein n=1 Tax=Durusdinium trenchii TaxID=1381693 RepID=A0ABP0RL16_9DINO
MGASNPCDLNMLGVPQALLQRKIQAVERRCSTASTHQEAGIFITCNFKNCSAAAALLYFCHGPLLLTPNFGIQSALFTSWSLPDSSYPDHMPFEQSTDFFCEHPSLLEERCQSRGICITTT